MQNVLFCIACYVSPANNKYLIHCQLRVLLCYSECPERKQLPGNNLIDETFS